MVSRLSLRLLGLGLFLAVGLPATALRASDAHAAVGGAVFGDLVIEMLPVGSVYGSGQGKTLIHVLALDRSGEPLGQLEWKAQSTGGELSQPTSVGPGLFRMEWTPPLVDAPREVEISLKGKTVNKDKIAKAWAISVLPVPAQRVTLAASPPALVLGQDATASLTVTLTGGATAARDGGDLEFNVSSGTLSNLTPMGSGAYSALYTPPVAAKGQPQRPGVAVITVADRRDPSRTYGVVSIPLQAKAELPVKGGPGGSVLLRLGGREFGPVTADKSGNAKVQAILSPGVGKATVVSYVNNVAKETPLDLKLTPAARVRLLPTFSGVPADPALSVPLRAFVVTPEGQPDSGAKPVIKVSAGVVSDTRHEGNGVYVASWSPPVALPAPTKGGSTKGGSTAGKPTPPGAVSVEVVLPEKGQQDKRSVTLSPGRAVGLSLTPSPSPLPAGVTTLEVTAHVTGRDGQGLAGRSLAFKIDGGRIAGPVKDLTQGDYKATFTVSGKSPVDLLGTVKAPANQNPVRQILVLPTRSRLPLDGVSSTMLTVLCLDEFGYPVTGVPLELDVTEGDGMLPAKATTDDAGVAQVYYTTGREPGLVRVEARAQGQSGGAPLIQLPPEVIPALDRFPVSGPQSVVDGTTAWMATVNHLFVPLAP